MKKQNIIVIGIVAFALALAVGYALFSQTLTITGTATASGNFNVDFVPMDSGEEVDIISSGDFTNNEPENLAIISGDSNQLLTLNVNKLDAPGGYVTLRGKVKNLGTMDAKLKDIKLSGPNSTIDGQDTGQGAFLIEWDEEVMAVGDIIKANGGTQEFELTVRWNSEADQSITDASAKFNIQLGWEQTTVDDVTTAAQ